MLRKGFGPFRPNDRHATAHELLGLPVRFTSAELRQAWLRLVRELHPDRWAAAGEGAQQMKEAALKRVNAARDELAPQVVGRALAVRSWDSAPDI